MVFDKDYILHTLLARIKEEWRTSESFRPDFMNEYETFIEYNTFMVYGNRQKTENEKRIAEGMERFKAQMNSFPYPIGFFGKKKKWKWDTERMFGDILWKEPLLGIENAMSKETLEAFKVQTKLFLRKIRKFDSALSIEDMGQALRNYMVYAIFLELNGLPQRCSSAIFGYSMLYPYTDNYIDDPDRTKEEKQHYNKLIADKIKGKPYEALSVHEERTAELLAAVEDDYGRPDDIFDGLLYMLDAQKISQKQADKSVALTEEEILDISIYKGGLSVLIDRYFINKPLSENDLYFYFGFGFLLQLCDDLQDISQDKKDGSRTAFSVCGSAKEVEENINRLLHYTKKLFASCESENEEFKQFLLRNCYLLILFSAEGSGEHVTEEWFEWMEERLPVSAAYFDGFKGNFARGTLQKDKRKYMRMMDVLL